MKILKRILLALIFLLLCAPCVILFIPGIKTWLDSTENSLGYIEIILAYLSLLSSGFIAVLIYHFEKKNTDKERSERVRSAKLMMYNELDKAIRLYILCSDQYVNSSLAHLKDAFREHAFELHDGLTEEQYSYLNVIVDRIDSFIVSVEEYGRREASEYILPIFREWLRLFFKSEYYESFSKVKDYKELLDRKTFQLLNALNGSKEKYRANLKEIKDTDDRVLFSYVSDTHICVLENGILQFDGYYRWDDVLEELTVTGYQRIYNYAGNFENGVRCGQGKELNHNGKVLAEGLWQNDELVSGTEYDWVIKVIDGQDEEETYFRFYEDRFSSHDGRDKFAEMLIECKSFDGCYLADGVIRGERMYFENLRPFGEFVKTLSKDEDHYSYLIE